MADNDDAQEVHVNGTSTPSAPTAITTTALSNDATATESTSKEVKGSATAAVNGDPATESTKHRRQGTDPEAQEMVISSLRSQIQDLFSQVNELNNKLVKSYDRVSDLEDDIHVASANLRQSSLRISQLELERTQHLAALNTGLLVEKAHVTAELNRLMEKATEEAAQRGQAESARVAIEKDLDDLSASLFGQANTMVAEARFAQHLSERKVEDAERALKDAEEMVGLMQVQMQAMQEDKEKAEKKMQEMQEVMGKGKYREREQRSMDLVRQVKLLSSHVPYQEFLLFVAHLRSLHLTSPLPPAMATLLPLPFLARLTTEEVEPTVRLDLAPALNWLSRRSVLSAIHSGQLTIEPIPVAVLFSETTIYSGPTTIAGVSPNNDSVSCALCGAIIVAAAEHAHQRRRPPSLTGGRNAWSGSFFKKSTTITGSRPSSPISPVAPPLQLSASTSSQNGTTQPPQQVYVFRVASTQSTTSISSALPIPSIAKSLSQGTASPSSGPSLSGSPVPSSSPNNQHMTVYPLCSSGWCLARLRTTCQLWSFVRTGIVDKVWEEEVPSIPVTPTSTAPASTAISSNNSGSTSDKPPVPPRKRGLWGGIASAFGERASSWTGDSAEKKAAAAANASATPPPPSHPAASHPPPVPPREPRRMPPPPKPVKEPSPLTPEAEVTTTVIPSTPVRESKPPLPPRNGKRSSVGGGGDAADTPASTPSSPMRVVFDMTHPQSPLRKKDKPLPSESAIHESADTLAPSAANASEPTAAPAPSESEASPPTSSVSTTDTATPAGAETAPASTASKGPAETPLPDSRPNSPAVPARVGSPAVASAVANASGSTPPPLPRRAAARRAVPPPPGGGEAGSRPGTPLRKVANAEEKSAEKVEEKAIEKVEEKSDAKEAVATKQEVQEQERKAVESDSDEEFVDSVAATSPMSLAASGGDSTANPVNAVPTVLTSSDSAQGLKPMDEKKIQSVDTVKDTAEERDAPNTSLALTPEDLEPTLATAATALGGVEKHDSKTDDPDTDIKEEGRDGKEVYVGDATWEERTWKEIVRLKEDMFWARIGGWRD